MKKSTQLLLISAGILLAISIFVPIWRIDLDAPQYPEGLRLLIYSNKLAGAVDIINGLNHYIGMKTLHANDFVEFTVLPYIIGAFAAFAFITAATKNKKLLYILFSAFVLFGIVAMIDFWRWEYDYGHNLNPEAAIIVPGMAYQPPLIGFKQLLNFGAYSVPDIGGLFFIIAGICMLMGVWIEKKLPFLKKSKSITILFLFSSILMSCNTTEPNPINYNKDTCDNCKMTISDPAFSCEFKTNKGKAYKFDDLICMLNFVKDEENVAATKNISTYYISDFLNSNSLINAEKIHIIQSGSLSSPMGGGYAAFMNLEDANKMLIKYNANIILKWEDVLNHKSN